MASMTVLGEINSRSSTHSTQSLQWMKAMETTVPPYEMIIYWSKADEAFLVEVPELPGCMADGATQEEALANAKTVIREWIETAGELGRKLPELKGRLIDA